MKQRKDEVSGALRKRAIPDRSKLGNKWLKNTDDIPCTVKRNMIKNGGDEKCV